MFIPPSLTPYNDLVCTAAHACRHRRNTTTALPRPGQRNGARGSGVTSKRDIFSPTNAQIDLLYTALYILLIGC